ncbi:unnamed protein product [Lymnaea stagnalis]|uniref:Cadherin domain-containing protein n=1 Tax=Lymnaea stagnalis TaxID=6523 RepID=A0AAV2HCH3_LYMST
MAGTRLPRLETLVLLAMGAVLVGSQSSTNRIPSLVTGQLTYFTVPENAPIGSSIFQISATDQDGDHLTFKTATDETTSLVNIQNVVNQGTVSTCKITLKIELDCDNSPRSRFLYFIIADNVYEIRIKITMIITDVNDNPPSFVALPYITSIPEDQAVNSVIFTVLASDPDTGLGGNIKYSFKSDQADYNAKFDLDPISGNITLKTSLDYEERSFYHLKISSMDEGSPSCPSPQCICKATPEVCKAEPVDLFITILDVEDTPPVFEGLPYIGTVSEDKPEGFLILRVIASDGDRGVAVPNNVYFTISGGKR